MNSLFINSLTHYLLFIHYSLFIINYIITHYYLLCHYSLFIIIHYSLTHYSLFIKQTTNICLDKLHLLNIIHVMNQNINESLEDNYNRFAHLVNAAGEKHLATNIVKYNKKKHKKIMVDDLWDFRIHEQ